MRSKKNIQKLLKSLTSEDKELMLACLLEAIRMSKQNKSLEAIEECIASWEATVELTQIPGLKERVWERYERLKSSGLIHDRKMED